MHGATAITALTAQNTAASPASIRSRPSSSRQQVRAVAQDLGVDAVKIGMLGDAPAIEAVAQALDELPRRTRRSSSTRSWSPSPARGSCRPTPSRRSSHLILPRAHRRHAQRPRGRGAHRAAARATRARQLVAARSTRSGRARSSSSPAGTARRPPTLLRRRAHHRDPRRAPPRRRRPRLGLHALEHARRAARAGRRPARSGASRQARRERRPCATACASWGRAPGRWT